MTDRAPEGTGAPPPFIAVVGTSDPSPELYATAEEVGRRLAKAGATVVCGGLGGVMEAVCRGASQARGRTVAILPGPDRGAANAFVDLAIATGLGEARNALVARAGDAMIAVGGGYGTLAEVALALRGLYGVETRLRLDRVRDVSRRVRELSGYELEPWKPLVGENLFTRESGAVASQFHDPPAIEPYSAGLVGAERRIVLGKKSGLDSIRIKVAELGLDVPEERFADLLAQVKARGMAKRGLVTDDEFRELARG